MPSDAAFLHHRLRLFFSADLLGSTALKQGREKEHLAEQAVSLSWFRAVGLFYGALPAAFRKARRDLDRRLPDARLAGGPRVLWKVLGDEILYYQEITDYRQALVAMHAWRTALAATRSVIRREFPDLDLKSAAWVANFPGPNFELALSADDDAASGGGDTRRGRSSSLAATLSQHDPDLRRRSH